MEERKHFNKVSRDDLGSERTSEQTQHLLLPGLSRLTIGPKFRCLANSQMRDKVSIRCSRANGSFETEYKVLHSIRVLEALLFTVAYALCHV